MKRSRLGAGQKSLDRGSTFSATTKQLKRTAAKPRRHPISAASPEQRERVMGKACIVCAAWPCHPAHLVSRAQGGTDDPKAVVPLCPVCHRDFDDGRMDLLPFLEPRYREELAYAVELVGLVRALERVTNERWSPERAAA